MYIYIYICSSHSMRPPLDRDGRKPHGAAMTQNHDTLTVLIVCAVLPAHSSFIVIAAVDAAAAFRKLAATVVVRAVGCSIHNCDSE